MKLEVEEYEALKRWIFCAKTITRSERLFQDVKEVVTKGAKHHEEVRT